MSKILKYILVLIIIIILIALGINLFVIASTKENIITEDEAKEIGNIDCIIILGAGVRGNNPSPMLEDRLLQGIELYKQGVAKKIIMSGDHGSKDYDEVNVMKNYAIEHGVPSEDIFMDHAGFSSYESMYRAKEIFGVNRVIVITQKYHLYRSLYIAEKLGLEAWRSSI